MMLRCFSHAHQHTHNNNSFTEMAQAAVMDELDGEEAFALTKPRALLTRDAHRPTQGDHPQPLYSHGPGLRIPGPLDCQRDEQ